MGTHGTVFRSMIATKVCNIVDLVILRCYVFMVTSSREKVSHVSRPAEKLDLKCPGSVPEVSRNWGEVSRMAVFR